MGGGTDGKPEINRASDGEAKKRICVGALPGKFEAINRGRTSAVAMVVLGVWVRWRREGPRGS